MLVVIALGANALLPLGEPKNADAQLRSVAVAARAIAAVAREQTVMVTHGNGPQVGHVLEQALENEMPGRKIASLVTEVIVRLVPVGPRYADTDDGRRFAAELGWMVAQDGNGFRQSVCSPEPQRIVQLKTINTLIEAGVLVICVCGEGIAITEAALGLREVKVTIDTDLAAALVAEQVGADLLMLLSEVERVEVDWRTGEALPLGGVTTVDALRRISFAPGLKGPKVEAACRFVESTGKRAAIGALAQALEILRGDRGVQVTAPRIS
ncbi:MAG TPA: carbamate kinase [Candidatus Dormibacteraeota bacterium]